MRRRGTLLLVVAATACVGRSDAPLSPHGFAGTELARVVPKPEFQFSDSRGHPFRFDSATAGQVTLLMFGYINCPDVCPVHLANLAAVLDRMPEEVQRQVTVVFVTTDPRRDSLPALDAWVKAFDPHFIGLTASDSVVAAAERQVNLLPAVRGAPDAKGSYAVGHSSVVIAYTRDGWGRVEYPFGTRERDWAHDLPLLVGYGQ
ncbi:MAG: SCO family protein [Gemmatimonadales bacterium]